MLLPIPSDSVGDFLVVRAPFTCGAGGDRSRFIAFTTLAQRVDGSVASFRMGTQEQARRELEAALEPLELTWLNLEHEAEVVLISTDMTKGAGAVVSPDKPASDWDGKPANSIREVELRSGKNADAGIVCTPGCAVAFTTADCLPIVLVSESCNLIAGIHAGWRSIAKRVIENCCTRFIDCCGGSMPEDAKVWIGPTIQAADFEIDEITRTQLLASPSVSAGHFSPTSPGHFLADLSAMAIAKFGASGVLEEDIEIQLGSTFSDLRFHSARRDKNASGRMATVVGIV